LEFLRSGYTSVGRVFTLRYVRTDHWGLVSQKALLDGTLEGFRGFASCLEKVRVKGVIYGTGAWNIGDIRGRPAMKQAYEMGKNA